MPEIEDQLSDVSIVSAFRIERTRESAFTSLVRKYQQRLYWHIRRMVVVHEDADDILQNVFIKVWRNLDKFREESNLYTWLYRIATNETISWIETQKRNAALSIDADDAFFEDKLKAQSDFDPRNIEWKLQQAVCRLPEKQKLVFNLRYFDEMPYTEMAGVLDTSAGALKASYHHALKKVEEFLKGV